MTTDPESSDQPWLAHKRSAYERFVEQYVDVGRFGWSDALKAVVAEARSKALEEAAKRLTSKTLMSAAAYLREWAKEAKPFCDRCLPIGGTVCVDPPNVEALRMETTELRAAFAIHKRLHEEAETEIKALKAKLAEAETVIREIKQFGPCGVGYTGHCPASDKVADYLKRHGKEKSC